MNVDLEECSPFAVTKFNNNSGSVLTSTIEATVASPNLFDGTTIECFAGGHSESLQVGNVSINVIGTCECISHNVFHIVMFTFRISNNKYYNSKEGHSFEMGPTRQL